MDKTVYKGSNFWEWFLLLKIGLWFNIDKYVPKTNKKCINSIYKYVMPYTVLS